MPRFILHVGPHKTGTSYLQEAFARTRGQLAARGVLYPELWGRGAHHGLLERLHERRGPELQRELERQFRELRAAGFPTVLISVEGLTTLPPEVVAELRALIGADNPVRVVFYARSWADRLASHWRQATRGGAVQSLPEYLYDRVAHPVGSHLVNFGTGLRPYAAAFGAAALAVVAYDAVMAEGRDLFRHFAENFLDWPDPPALALAPVNVSPGAADIEVIRVLNSIEAARRGAAPEPAAAARMSERYLRQADRLAGPELRAALRANLATALLDEAGPQLAALHRELYAEFGHAMVEPHVPELFFVPRRAEIGYVQRDYLLVPGVVEALHAIHRAVGKQE